MILTEARTWQQLPTDSERLFFLRFNADHTGHLVSGGGQVISLDVEFDYQVRGDQLELRFRDSAWGYAEFRRTAENETRVVRFELIEGAHTFYVPDQLADVTYRWRLRFDRSPLPVDAAQYHRSNYFRQNPFVDPTLFTDFYGVPIHERRFSTAELTAVFDKWDRK
jgi:hypothetical protein